MNRYISMFALAMGSILQTAAYTPAETNAVVEAALDYLQQVYPDNWETNFIEMADEEIPDTWINFLGGDETNGWTYVEKRAAFDWYLNSLGTADCQQLSSIGKWRVRAALWQCDVLNYTNSWPYLKALALNPLGICREEAIELAIMFGPVNDTMTEFVESVLTNRVVFNEYERNSACARYRKKFSETTCPIRDRDNAVRMYYQHRYGDLVNDLRFDAVFSVFIDGYVNSSNRMEYALYILNHPDCGEKDRLYFTSVTNLLLNVAQPLCEVEALRGL